LREKESGLDNYQQNVEVITHDKNYKILQQYVFCLNKKNI
jgi:hypothetical protein